ncbi:MAG: TIGR03013 family PEP-CTERM/XrtA system glycosyltransferase [Ectothiorhodospiraceae bacterium]|nr:TIGR03013 family PEP-CTERM/XrtA system glycosyltransferase [Ectothiorhodospiraceae bacterium]
MVRLFNHYIPRGTLLVLLLEALILAASVYIAVRFWLGPDSAKSPLLLSRSLAEFSAVMLGSMMLMGLYTAEPAEGEGWRGTLFRLMVAFMLGFAVLLAFNVTVGPGSAGNYPLGVSVAIALVAISTERLLFVRWRSLTGPLLPRALVLGTGNRAAQIDTIQHHGGLGPKVDVVGYLPVIEDHHDVPDHRLLQREDGESLWEFADRQDIDEIIVGVRERRGGGLPIDELLQCKLHGIRITDISSFFERERGQVRLESLNSSWLVFGDGFRQNFWRNLVKRTFDITASALVLILALPIMLITALLIRFTMGSPVFYWQERVGRDGRTFHICKFRSMRNDAEIDGQARWASADDDRITPVGRVIRKLRIDELPQIFNVFRGEMSFVGPRPERPQFVDELTQQIPFYQVRHSVRPGITGWAQVRYPYGASVDDAREKLQYDIYYVKNRSLFLDLTIMMQTVEVVLWGRGSR